MNPVPLSLAWPPTNTPPESPVMWLRDHTGGMFYLNLKQYAVVPLFITEEAAKVVAMAIQNLFDVTPEIRSARVPSRSMIETTIRESGELRDIAGECKIIWEDDEAFESLLLNLQVNIV